MDVVGTVMGGVFSASGNAANIQRNSAADTDGLQGGFCQHGFGCNGVHVHIRRMRAVFGAGERLPA